MYFQKKHVKVIRLASLGFLMAALLFIQATLVQAGRLSQIPTVSIPTVTGTPVGAIAVVKPNDQGYSNVRAGPSTVDYEIIGVLTENSAVPALGRSPGGDWILIAYPGVPGGIAWIYADNVDVKGTLPVVEPPPTPTPRVTPTIDPTLAAQFLVEAPVTRLPTYTAPPPITVPTFQVDAPITSSGRIPMGLVIIALAVIGIFGTLISLLSGR